MSQQLQESLSFDRLEHVIDRSGLFVPLEVRERARRRALAAFESPHGGDGVPAAVLQSAVEALATLAVDLAADPTTAANLIEEIERACGVPRLALGCELLRSSDLVQLPAGVAVEVQLGLVLTFAQAEAVSLWTVASPGGDLKHVAHAGEFNLHALDTRRVARRLLSGNPPRPQREGSIVGVLVAPSGQEPAALIARGASSKNAVLPLLEASVPMLSTALAQDKLRRGERQSREDGAVPAETRLAQLRFELHDGPQQDVVLLAEDLRLLRTQLASVIEDHPAKERLLRRIDDLVGGLAALDGDLRRISSSLAASFAQTEPLIDALLTLADTFSARTGIEPETNLEGDLTRVTDPQLTALVALLREALTNIRKHSNARHVKIHLTGGPQSVEVTVTDDGRGFDPELALVRAAREGHVGLAGIHERVLALGGRISIDSRPGGPTFISAVLPATAENARRR